MKRISDHLYRWEDLCHVYVIKRGEEAVCVDFGTGAVLDALPSIGVRRITDVLMTHHHRDQGQGLERAAREGIRIWVPDCERDLFARVDEHWQARELTNNYNTREDRFSLLRSVPVAGTLKDYNLHDFGGLRVRVLPTPGHTVGSVSLLAEVDGEKSAFTGDLIAGEGKLWSLAATQWTYNGAEGVPYTILSLLRLKREGAIRWLPSHGEGMEQPERAADRLIDGLWQLLCHRGHNLRLFDFHARPFEPVTPHLLRNRTSVANHYVLLSESGKALFIDFGYDFVAGLAAGSDRAARRPWLYTLDALKEQYGVTRIDVVIPTHYHDDHVAGFNLLREAEGTRVWAPSRFADLLRRPGRYDLPCLWHDPIPVDRELPAGVPFRWEEYALTVFDQPGHTFYASAIGVEADGKRVLFIGDQHEGSRCEQWNYVYQNGFSSGDYIESARLYDAWSPDVILSGHADPYWVTADFFEKNHGRGETLHELHRRLLPPERERGAEGSRACLRPYQSEVVGGETLRLEAELTNPFDRPAEATATLVVPAEWRAEPSGSWVTIPARGSATFSCRVTPPAGKPMRRVRIALDVTMDGKAFGQSAEALVTVMEREGESP